MKEFTSQTGGRYTYIDDIMNLQELSLAFASIFDTCDNFIISGCQVAGNKVGAGFVYINGKIRSCPGAAGVSQFPVYIYESNSIETVSYFDAGDKIGRNVYGCVISSELPTANDPLTGKLPQAISLASDGTAIRLKDAFFGKYALMIDSPFASQTIQKDIAVKGSVTADKSVVSRRSMDVVSGKAKASISYDTPNALTLQSSVTGKPVCKLVITEDGSFQFFTGTTLLATLDTDGMVFKVPLITDSVQSGNLAMDTNDLYNAEVSADTGAVRINMTGYRRKADYYRDTVIGDGKNHAILTIEGKTKESTLTGTLTIESSQAHAMTLIHSTLAKDTEAFVQYIAWKDKNKATMAHVGYVDGTSFDWCIENLIGNIVLKSDTYVVGSLFVNGIDMDVSKVDKTVFTTALNDKANVADVYSKTDAEKRFVRVTDDISVFVTQAGGGEEGKALVREGIGACSVADMSKAVMKAQLFGDIVSEGLPAVSDTEYAAELDTRKRTLCDTIGAVYSKDAVKPLKDTGWIRLELPDHVSGGLYVRQVGAVVSIQGFLNSYVGIYTTPNGGGNHNEVFTLPNVIDPPSNYIGHVAPSASGDWFGCTFDAHSRNCFWTYQTTDHYSYVGFLMTYII